jgi:hypothetical protein
MLVLNVDILLAPLVLSGKISREASGKPTCLICIVLPKPFPVGGGRHPYDWSVEEGTFHTGDEL